MNFPAYSIRNPIPAVLLFILLTLAGLIGFRASPIQDFPDIELPVVTVDATLPGAAPAQLETEVARKIENAVAVLQGVKHVYTRILDGTVSTSVEFVLESNQFLRVGLEAAVFSAQTLQLSSGLSVHLRQGR